MIDNLLRPPLVGKGTRLPDYMVLVSTLGGISLFGVNGFVIGPLIAAMFVAIWSLFKDDRAPAAERVPAGGISGPEPASWRLEPQDPSDLLSALSFRQASEVRLRLFLRGRIEAEDGAPSSTFSVTKSSNAVISVASSASSSARWAGRTITPSRPRR